MAQVAASFLDKNAQAHASALTAFGDVIDNGRESGATSVRIEYRSQVGAVVSSALPSVISSAP